jgi:hypothetical protein
VRKFVEIAAEQRTPEWYAARVGRLTGSVAGDMLAKIKSGEAAGRRNLRLRLVLERLTGKPQESGFVSQAMQDGIDREALAFAAYEALTGEMVQRSGFLCAHRAPGRLFARRPHRRFHEAALDQMSPAGGALRLPQGRDDPD